MEFIPVKECGNYLVSKEGKVFSLLTMKEIKTFKLKLGYYAFEMRINGKRKVKYLHRALAELFVENPNNKPNVNHIDGVKTNNNIENLEWVTQKENIVHAWKTGLSKTTEKSRERCRQMGLSHSKEKRTQIASLGGKASALKSSKQVICTKTFKVFKSMSEAARNYGFATNTLSRWLSGARKNNTNLLYLDKFIAHKAEPELAGAIINKIKGLV